MTDDINYKSNPVHGLSLKVKRSGTLIFVLFIQACSDFDWTRHDIKGGGVSIFLPSEFTVKESRKELLEGNYYINLVSDQIDGLSFSSSIASFSDKAIGKFAVNNISKNVDSFLCPNTNQPVVRESLKISGLNSHSITCTNEKDGKTYKFYQLFSDNKYITFTIKYDEFLYVEKFLESIEIKNN